MKVMVIGATGLTGAEVVLGLLNASFTDRIVVLTRRALTLEHPKLDQHLVDFDQLESLEALFAVDALVVCLGTTIKKAGSKAQFRRVDYGYALAASTLARAQGATGLILMSAVGASPSSAIFYSRVKGELEMAVRQLGYPFLSIYHPSLLLGHRDEHRTAESMGVTAMAVINRALLGPLKKYRGIEASVVAAAMVNDVGAIASGQMSDDTVRILDYEDIVALATETTPSSVKTS